MNGAPPRADVVGSLLRPQRLRRAREEHAAGRLGPAEFKRIEDAEVDRAVTGTLRRRRSLAQIDAPELATLVDPAVRESFHARGIDPGRMLGEGIEILNSVAETPGGPHAIHLGRGNRDGHWMASGGYEAIAKEVFTRATRFETFFLEYDDERSGGFEPLEDLPQDRTVVLGLVSTKRTELEDADALLGRIDEAARFHPRDRLAVSPQCGFESAIGDYPLDEAGQERKLRLAVEVAERAWPA